MKVSGISSWKTSGNRSGCENGAYTLACSPLLYTGIREGAVSPRRAASHTAVRYPRTLRFCCFNVITTVIMCSTKREPSLLCVPKLPLRHSTPGRIDHSAALLVGSTPSTCTNVHNASRRFRTQRTHIGAKTRPFQRAFAYPMPPRKHLMRLRQHGVTDLLGAASAAAHRFKARNKCAQHSCRHRTGYPL